MRRQCPWSTLYQWCEMARELVDSMGFGVGRVIARPFTGRPGNYTRTANRHDYAATPPKKTDLELLHGVQDSWSIPSVSLPIFSPRHVYHPAKDLR